MSKYGGNNRIDFGVHFNTDKSSLADVKKSLEQISKMPLVNFKGSSTELLKLKETVKDISSMLDSAFNAKLNTINVDKFKTSLDNSKYSLQSIYNELSKAGAVGQRAFSQMASSVLTTNLQLKETHSLINSMGTTMMNTVKWGIASSVMNNFTSSVSQAFQYVKSLDSALTDIRIVTGDSTQQMAKFADQANRAAQELGRSTMDYSKAALTFYQQGLSDEDVAARTEATLKAQNITGAGEQMADYLTAVWNGYKVANEEAELYVDKLAAVADSSASNMSQLAIAMSKVASTANLLGVPVDSLNAQIATIVATTRQAPETVGNALKTIYARINDIKTGSDEAEISLGNYTSQMAQLGVNVLDASGNLRDTGDVIEEIGGKWESLSREQQIYLARTMAGQRQYNNLLALFENWSKYTDLVNVSMDAQGTTMEKNSRYMDSLAAHMEQLGAAGQRVKSALVDSDSFKGLIDLGTTLTNFFANFIQSIGGGGTALLALGGIATQVFGNTISREINNIIVNQQKVHQNMAQLKADIAMTQDFGKIQGLGEGVNTIVSLKKEAQQYYNIMNAEQINAYNNLVKEVSQLEIKKEQYKDLADLAGGLQAAQDTGLKVNGKDVENLKDYKQKLQEINQQIQKLNTQKDPNSFINKGLNGQTVTKSLQSFGNQIKEVLPEMWGTLTKNADFTRITNDGTSAIKTSFDSLLQKEQLSAQQAAHLQAELNKIVQTIKNTDPQQYELLRQKLIATEAEADRAKKRAQEYLQEINQLSKVQSFVKVFSGLSQIAAGLQSITNLTKVWKNESLSGTEKVLQTFTALGMGIGMVVNGLNQLKPVALKALSAIVLQATGGSAALNMETLTTLGLSAALKEANVSAGMLLTTTLGILAPFLAVGAAIGVFIGALVALDKAYNKNAIAAKQAQEQANKAKEFYEQTKQTMDELKTSIEKISQAQNNLDILTRGTEEWNSALKECNSSVLELIRNYPNLSKYVDNVNGQLRLSEEGQREALKAAEDSVNAANRAFTVVSQNARQANILSDATDLGRGIVEKTGIRGTSRSGDVDPSRVLEITNTLIDIEKGLSDFDASSETLSEYISRQTDISQKTVQAVLASEEDLNNLQTAVEDNTAAIKIENEARAAEIMKQQDYYKNASQEDKKVLDTLGAGTITALEKTWKERLEEPLAGEKAQNQDESYWNDILTEMSRVLGKNVEWAENSIRGGNGKRSGERKLAFDVDGQSDPKVYSVQYVASIMAAKDALEDLGTSASGANQILQKLGQAKIGENAQIGVKGFITGQGMGSLTLGDLDELDENSIEDIFGGKDNLKEVANSLGVSVDKVKKDFHSMVFDTEVEFASLQKSLPEKVGNAFNNISKEIKNFDFDKDLTLDAQKGIATALNEAFKAGGSQGLQTMKKSLSSFNLDKDDFNSLGKALEQMDWSSPEAIADLNKKIQQQGIDIDTTSDKWIQFTNYLSSVAGKARDATSALDQLRGILQGISALRDMKTGDVLDDEKYTELINQNKELQKYFRMTADGYMFIGSQEEVAQILKANTQTTIDSFHEMRDAAKTIVDNEAESAKIEKAASYQFDEKTVSGGADIQANFSNDKAFDNALASLGLDKQAFDDAVQWIKDHNSQAIDQMNAEDKKAYEDNTALIQDYFQKVNQLQTDYKDDKYSSKNEESLIAGEAIKEEEALQALRKAYQEDQISEQTYHDFREAAVQSEIERLGITKDAWQDASKTVKEQIENVSSTYKNLSDAEKEIEVDELTAKVLEWGQALDEIGKISEETVQNWQGLQDFELDADDDFQNLKENLQQIFDTEIDSSILADHLDLIQRLVNGDITALTDLQIALNQDYSLDISADVDWESGQQAVNDFNTWLGSIDLDDLSVGMSLDDAGYTEAMQNFIDLTGASVDEMQTILGQMGFEPNVDYKEVPVEQFVKDESGKFYTYKYTTQDGQQHEYHVSVDDYNNIGTSQTIRVPILHGNKIKFNASSGQIGNLARPNYSKAAAPKSKGGGGGKKGGGGSSGKPSLAKKNETKIDAKLKEQENDPYYKINNSIEKQSTLLKRLQDQEKNLSGKDRLKNLDAQAKNLKEQNELLEQRNRISNNVAAENSTANLRKRLQNAFGKNISFDSEGKIADLNQTERAAVDSYNKAAQQAQSTFESVQKQYNNWILHTWNANSKAWQEAHQSEKEKWDERIKNAETNAKDAISAAEEEYKKKTDLIKAYEKALQEDQKRYEQYMNNIRKIMESTFEQRKIKIQFNLDSGELDRDWQDFQNKVIRRIKDSDIVGNAAAQFRELSSYIQSQELQSVSDEIKAISDDIARVNAGAWTQLMGISQTDYEMLKPEDQQLVRKEALGMLEEQLKDLVKQEQDALSAIQDLTDEIAESYLDSIDAAKDALDEHIDQYERINDLIEHNVKLTELLYGDKGYDTLNKYYDLQKQNNMNTLQTLKQQEEYWRSRMQNEVVGSEAWKKFKENLDDAVDAVNSKLEDMLDNLTTQFEKKLAAAVERVNNKLTGGLGTSYLDEQWDYLNNYDDYFLDTYNATTGIEDVTRAYQQALDDAAANPKQQQRLNKLMNDQLKILREKDHLTEYDLERAKSMLEVEKARMALEDARNNKTKMRLRRDSQGNYTYQYVADEEKLGDLQQALADAQNDLYNQDKEHYKENLNTLYDTYKEYLEKMQELTEEYRQAQAEAEATGNDTWLKQVQTRIDLAKEYYNNTMTGLLEDNEYNQTYITQSFANGLNLDLSGLSSEEAWGVIQENVPWAASNIQNLANSISNLGGLLPATNSLLQDFSSAAAQYKADMNDILEAGGTSIQTIGQVINEEGGPLDTNIIEANSQVIMGYLDEITQKALTDVNTMQDLTQKLDEYWQNLNNNIQTYINNTRDAYNTLQELLDSSTRAEVLDYTVPQINTTSTEGLAQAKEQLSLENISGKDINTLYNNYLSYLQSTNGALEVPRSQAQYQQLAENQQQLQEQYDRFYTDLVQDMVQQVSSMSIDSQIDQMTTGTSQLLSNLIKNQSLLDQNVHIDANFPNVNNHTQIEEAFNNLVNMAAMRASGYRD